LTPANGQDPNADVF
jgi:Niemann-Pick C1 protein